MPQFINKNQSGFSLLEILVSVLILTVFIVGTFNLIIYSLRVTTDNKLRLAATMVANQKMENARNLPYDDVGTSPDNVIPGIIPDKEIINQNNGIFTIDTFVNYKDDSFDGEAGGSPDDAIPSDYKVISIKVSWDGPFGLKNVTTFSKIAPKGLETSVVGGILTINVFNANGMPVDQAEVDIDNPSLGFFPSLLYTDSDGILNFPSLTESIEGYEISVTKTSLSADYTSDRDGTNPSPTKPHATVLNSQKTEISFAIDLLSNLTIKTITAALPPTWQVNTDENTAAQTNSRLAISTNYIYIVWQDYQGGGTKSKIYAQKYDKSGNAQWPNTSSPADKVIASMNDTVLPDILVDSPGDLYLSWSDDANGNKEAYLVKLNGTDGSNAWGGAKKINTQANSDDQEAPKIAIFEDVGDTFTYAAWQDNRSGAWDVYMQKFDSSGNSLWSPEKIVNTTPTNDQYSPVITADSNGDIYIAWASTQNTDIDIYAAKFDSNGNTLWAEKLINTDGGSTDQYSPDIAVDSADNIYIVWADERNLHKDIYAAKFDSTGTAQWAPDNIKINTDGSSADQYSPTIAINAIDEIYIAWTDELNGNQDIYAQKYNTSGVYQWTADLRVNINNDNSNQYNPDITIDPSNGDAYVSWQDDRNGDLDIYVSKLTDYTSSELPETNVPITVAGAKKVGENPIIYKYNRNYTSDGSGNVSLTNIEWDSYTITLQGGSGYTIVMSTPSQPVSLDPNTSITAKLYLTQP